MVARSAVIIKYYMLSLDKEYVVFIFSTGLLKFLSFVLATVLLNITGHTSLIRNHMMLIFFNHHYYTFLNDTSDSPL